MGTKFSTLRASARRAASGRRRIPAGVLAAAPALLLALPLLAAAPPAHAAEVAYRVEGRDARLVLRWRKPVTYSFKKVGSLYLFRFSRPVAGSVAPFAASVRKLVGQVRLLGKGRVLMVRTRPGKVALRHRKNGNAIIIVLRDLAAAAGHKPAGKTASKPVTPQRVPLSVIGLGKKGGYMLAFRWRIPFEYRVAAQRRRVTLVFSRPGRIVPSAVALRNLRQRGIAMTQRSLGGTIIVTLSFKKDVRVRAARKGGALRLDVTPVAGAPARPPRRPGAINPRLTVSAVGGGTRLAFDWPVSVSAAAFRYGGHLWLVFGAPARFNLSIARQRLGKDVEDIEQTLLDNATIVRLRTSRQVSAVLEREGWEWRVTLRRGRLLPRTPIFVKVDPKKGRGGTVTMRAGAAGSVITITDPAVGSTLFILPLRAPGLGIERGKRFPTFRLLPSVQGIVVEPLSDGLTVAVRGDMVEITNPHGLFVSGDR